MLEVIKKKKPIDGIEYENHEMKFPPVDKKYNAITIDSSSSILTCST